MHYFEFFVAEPEVAEAREDDMYRGRHDFCMRQSIDVIILLERVLLLGP